MQDVSGMFHKREIGVRNDTYTRAEIDAKDGAIQAAADKAQETADGAVSVNNTQNTQISALQKSAHSHSNKDVLDKIEQPYTTAERDKLAGLENYVHPAHTAYNNGMYKVAVDDEGHVTEAETMAKSDITALGIPGENTTYEITRKGNRIYLEGSDKSSSSAMTNDYVTHGTEKSYDVDPYKSYLIFYQRKPDDATSLAPILDSSEDIWVSKHHDGIGVTGTITAGHFSGADATTSQQGLMSAADKTNLDANTAARHTHANKSILDQLNETQWKIINSAANKAHVHDNKNTLDKITDALWNTVYSNTHTHDNKAVLDKTTASYTTAEKTKLAGIADGANKYVHPKTSGNKHIPSGGSSGQILRWSADGTAVWGADNNTTYSDATQSAHGLMTAADKKKLDGMDLSKYLPLAGGVMTGDIDMATNGKDILVGSQRATNTAYATAIAGATITTKEAYSVGLTTRKSLIGSYMDSSGVWNNIISVRHRNGANDGTNFGMYLRSLLASNGNLIWNKQTAANTWQGERTLLDSGNYTNYALPKDGTAKKAELLSSGQMRTAYCHNDDATFSNGYVWFKIGTAFGSGGYATVTTTFLGICGYGKHALYTCRMRLTSAGNAVESITFLESGRTGGMSTGLFRVVAINGEKGVTFELWAKGASRWEGTRIAILNEQNLAGGGQPNFWVLTSRGNADAKTAPTSGNMYVDSSDSSICANATNATKWSNLVADISTYNTTDTWLLVNNNGKIQHRLEGDLKVLSATKLATARTLTIGNTGKSFNGAANVSWSLDEIGVLGRTTKGKTYKLNNVSYNGSATDYIFNDYTNNQAGGGEYITVTGSQNIALGGNCIFLAGWRNTAQGNQCVAMGQDNIVAGTANIALGSGNQVTADAQGGLALGNYNTCKANASLAGGWYTEVQKSSNQSIGYGNHVTVGTASCAAFGAYNGYSFSGPYLILGNGTSSARANAFRAAAAGVYSSGSYHSSGADYAEYFEWLDGNPNGEDRRGRFVRLDGEKILLAESIEDDILGIVSGNPSVTGDSYEDQWQGQYLTDIYGELLTEDYTDEDGTTRKVWVLNPDYDPEKVYVPRSERQEWSAVGMMGKLIVVDDGTCKPNTYCVPTTGGIATKSEGRVGYRVLSRIDDTHIKVLIKG